MKYKGIVYGVLSMILPMMSFSQSAEQRATAFINKLSGHDYQGAHTFIDESIKDKFTPDMLDQGFTGMEINYGDFVKINSVSQQQSDSLSLLFFNVTCKEQPVTMQVSMNSRNKVVGFFYFPIKTYEKKDVDDLCFEKELVIESNGYHLPGTLAVPKDERKKIIAVFVHGSGPNDRDETIYDNKSFRDIAFELSKHGISSYRYDKRTFVDPIRCMNNKNFTVDDETTNDAVNAVLTLKSIDSLSDYVVILIGHSLGGMMLPRIATRLGDKVEGLIFLAAPARPLDELLLEQYLFQADGNKKDKMVIQINQQVAYLHSDSFNLNSPRTKLPLNQPASYWTSLLQYNQVEEVKKLKDMPILVIQGGKDIQVRMKDFDLWKKACATNTHATFKSYKDINHILTETKEKPTGSDYKVKATIPDYVLKDISSWIQENNMQN